MTNGDVDVRRAAQCPGSFGCMHHAKRKQKETKREEFISEWGLRLIFPYYTKHTKGEEGKHLYPRRKHDDIYLDMRSKMFHGAGK